MPTMERWAEYEAGTLVPPVVIQHDWNELTGEHLVWVLTEYGGIQGPTTRTSWDASVEAECIAGMNLVGSPQYTITAEDGSTLVI